jgi:exonuclease III
VPAIGLVCILLVWALNASTAGRRAEGCPSGCATAKERGETVQIAALAREWVDVYRTAHPEDEGLTCCVDDLDRGPEQRLGKRIDYMYIMPGGGPEMHVLDARLVLDQPFRTADGWQWASDHVGLLAILNLE